MENNRLIEIDYRRSGRVLLRNIALIISITIACMVVGSFVVYYTMDREDQYSARSSVFCKSGNVYEETLDVVQYADLVKSLKVAQRAALIIDDPLIDKYKIYDMITVVYDDSPYTTVSSAVIDIFATSSDKEEIILVTNAVAKAFVIESFSITGVYRFEVLDAATQSDLVYDAQKEMLLYTILSAVFGLVLICLIIVLKDILSLRLHSIQDGTLYGELDIIGVIPLYKK